MKVKECISLDLPKLLVAAEFGKRSIFLKQVISYEVLTALENCLQLRKSASRNFFSFTLLCTKLMLASPSPSLSKRSSHM